MSITDIGPTQLDSFFTSTIKLYKKEQVDNFVRYRPAIAHLMEKAGMRDEGGYMVTIPVAYGQNTTVTFFDGMDMIDTTPQETNLPTQYFWKNIYGSVAISETEMLANSGKAQIFDLLGSRIDQCERTIRNIVNQEIFGDGTNYNGKTIIGFAAGISQTPTVDPSSGPVGGIPAAPNPWWQNIATGTFSWGSSGTNNGGVTDVPFNTYNLCTDGNEVYPTLMIGTQGAYQFYHNSLAKSERVVNTGGQGLKIGNFYFTGLAYGPHGTPFVWDRQCPQTAGGETIYMVNNQHVRFYVDPRWYFTWGPSKSWPNQEALVRICKLRLALCYTARLFLAGLFGITA